MCVNVYGLFMSFVVFFMSIVCVFMVIVGAHRWNLAAVLNSAYLTTHFLSVFNHFHCLNKRINTLFILSFPENDEDDDCNLPRSLLCGHIYCTSCLLAIHRDTFIICPECQVKFLALSTCGRSCIKFVQSLRLVCMYCMYVCIACAME